MKPWQLFLGVEAFIARSPLKYSTSEMHVALWRKRQKRYRCVMDVMCPKEGQEEAQDGDFTECTQGGHFSLAASVYSSVT